MTEEATDAVHERNFDADGPHEIEVSIHSGAVDVLLTDEPGITVRVRHRPDTASPWSSGIANLMSWVSGQFGGDGSGGSVDDAIEQTRIELQGKRLIVQAPKNGALRGFPLGVTVRAPSGSHVDVQSGSADVLVTGSAGKLKVQTGSGEIKIDRADGAAVVNTGTGAVRLGPMLGGLQARSGSGDVEVSSIGGSTALVTGSGDVWLGAVAADVMARTGSGDLTVADAASGKVDLHTGSGEIRVGVRQGTSAEIDLSSGSGQARSELDLSDSRPAGEPTLRVRGRTGSGAALVTSAFDG
jgi:putative adhesin